GTAPRFLVVHFVGLDHAGHAWGPQSDRYAVTARSLDGKIDGLLRAVDAETTVVITSDHAITNRGGHGGSDAQARPTPLVLLGPGIRRVSGLAVDQVDLTPTLAALIGVPIPAQSTGRIIHEALDISADQRERLLGLNRDQLLRLLEATYPSQWRRRLDDAREGVRQSAFLRSDDRNLSAGARDASETIDAIRQTIDQRDWDDRLPVIAWLIVGLLLCAWLWSSLRHSTRPTDVRVTVGAAAGILGVTFVGLSRPEVRLALSLCAGAAMFGVVLYHDRGVLRLARLVRPLLAAVAVAAFSALILYGRVHQYRSDTMFGDVHDRTAGMLGWGGFVVAARHARVSRVGGVRLRGVARPAAREALAAGATAASLGAHRDGRRPVLPHGFWRTAHGAGGLRRARAADLRLAFPPHALARDGTAPAAAAPAPRRGSPAAGARDGARGVLEIVRAVRAHQVEEPGARGEGGRRAPLRPGPRRPVVAGSQDPGRVHADQLDRVAAGGRDRPRRGPLPGVADRSGDQR